jgi:hypothetical protein
MGAVDPTRVNVPEPGTLVETLDPDKTTFALKRDARHMTFVAIEPREGKTGLTFS